MNLSLVVAGGRQEGISFPIPSSWYLIGRHPRCHLWASSPYISQHHCVITLRDGRAFVQDLCSTNGTYLNGWPIGDQQVELHPQDVLRLGPVTLVVHLVADDPSNPLPEWLVQLGGAEVWNESESAPGPGSIISSPVVSDTAPDQQSCVPDDLRAPRTAWGSTRPAKPPVPVPMTRRSRIAVEERGAVTVVRLLDGRIVDQAQVHEIAEELLRLVEDKHRIRLVLDLGPVAYLSSSMLGVLIKLVKTVAKADGHLKLSGLRGEILQTLRQLGLDELIGIYPDDEMAAGCDW